MEETEYLEKKLSDLKNWHRDLDAVIDHMRRDPYADQLLVQRLKKRKLTLKDEILSLEEQIYPDIIA